MKLNKTFYFSLLFALVFYQTASSQDNIGSSTSLNQPRPGENGTYQESAPFYPAYLDDQLKAAQESGDNIEAERISRQIDALIPAQNKFVPYHNELVGRPTAGEIQPPYNPDWYTTDVTVWAGAVKYGSPYFRQIDMRMAEDGNMYIALNREAVTGTQGRIDVYRSSNGGATWVYTNGIQYGTGYIGTVSMTVELRDSGNMDSTRVFVFYTISSTSNNDNASLAFASWRRTGAAWYYGNIAAPPAGQEFSFATSTTDGAFYSSATWVGVFCTQSNNALTTTNDFRSYRTTNWGQSFTGVTISTAYNDFYPSAELRPGSSSSSDSVWIAVERRFSGTQYDIRVIRTPWAPVASSNTYFVTNGGANVRYEKPALTVKQNRSCDSAMFTTTKNGVPYYCPTTNGGGVWNTDYTLGNGSNKAFTWCASGIGGPDPFMGMWVSSDGDSIGLRLGGRIGNLGTYVYKRNSNNASTSVSPTCIVYNPSANVNRAAFSYAGFGPTNIYANQENLVVGIQPNGNQIPETYSLEQNYPNPFNPTTNINFGLPKAGFVKLVIYDALGREVKVLVNGQMNAGSYKVDYNGADLSSGLYFYRLDSEGFSSVKKMMLVK